MKWSIGAKLLSIFGGAILFLIVGSLVAYKQLTEMIDTSSWVVHTYSVLEAADELRSLMKDAETGQRGFLITGEERYLAPYEAAKRDIEPVFSNLRNLVLDNPVQVQRLDHLKGLINAKLAELKTTIDLRRNSSFEAARKVVLTDEGRSIMEEFRKEVNEMESSERELLIKRDQETKEHTNATKYAIFMGIVLCLLMTIIASFVIIRHIARPLKKLAQLANQISAGDLNVDLPDQDRADEIGVLIKAFDRMTTYFKVIASNLTEISKCNLTVNVKPESEKDVMGNSLINMIVALRKITGELKEGASTLASSSGEILSVVSQVSSGASETSAAVSETTATVEQVKQTALASSQRAKGVSESAKVAAEVSQLGKASVDASMEGMRQIQMRMNSITENIMKLSAQGQTIGDIISAVNDLAEQSNLLAVNASIEAARAGEQGRGFMIVAQEVKILADQSKQATIQVREILNEIQKTTGAAVLAAEQGSKAVEAGINQVEQSGKSIQGLNERIIQAAQAAMQIVASSEQQVAGVTQVATAMENIKQASTQNVSGTKQVEDAAQNLNRVGQNLKNLVELFAT